MTASLEELEARMVEYRTAISESNRRGERDEVKRLRGELRAVLAEYTRVMDEGEELDGPDEPHAVDSVAPVSGGPPLSSVSVPIREQAHQALTILDAPAGPKLIAATHAAFLSEPVVTARLGSLRRDEERSFVAQPFARPYYICPALTHDRFTPVRGLLAVSTWPLEQRISGPLGPRVDFLTHARRVGQQVARIEGAGHQPTLPAWALLRRFALNIPGAYEGYGRPDAARVVEAADAEAAVHADTDNATRQAAAVRAREQLTDPARLLFGSVRVGGVDRADTGSENR
nr:hypothetical protein OH826_34570 [Streptomyces sp. NBC_00899]